MGTMGHRDRDMSPLERITLLVKLTAGAIAGLWANIPELTQFLVIMMAVDIFFGLALAIRDRKLCPGAAWDGITKKVGALVLIGVMGFFHRYVQFDVINLTQAASAFYLVVEGMSIIRNATDLGVLVPPQMKQVIEYFEGYERNSIENTRPKDPSRGVGGRSVNHD